MEQTIVVIRPSLRPIILLYVIVVLLFVITIAVHSTFFVIIAGLTAFITLIEVLILSIQRNFTVYTLSPEGIKFRTGIIAKRETTIPLKNIQNVTSIYSVTQRIFGMGNVIIESAAEHIGGIYLRNIERPEEIAQKILKMVQNQPKE